MNNDPFGLFVDLIGFDKKLIKLESDIKEKEHLASIYQKEIEELNSSLDRLRLSWVDARKIVDLYELKMKELDQLEKQKKEQLEQSQNNKEYSLLKKEIEKIKQSQYQLEPQIIAAWNKSESEKKEYDSKKSEFDKKISELQNQIDENYNFIKSLKEELNTLKKERQEKEKSIPEEWIIKYNKMRLRVQNPVAEVLNNSCSACFHHITSQNLIDLKRKALLECKRCFRFLYSK